MQIGEIYAVKPAFAIGDGSGMSSHTMKGQVVYVHPKGRFAVLAFPGVNGTARECFWPDELTDENRRKQ